MVQLPIMSNEGGLSKPGCAKLQCLLVKYMHIQGLNSLTLVSVQVPRMRE